jgi:hypothetical protein
MVSLMRLHGILPPLAWIGPRHWRDLEQLIDRWHGLLRLARQYVRQQGSDALRVGQMRDDGVAQPLVRLGSQSCRGGSMRLASASKSSAVRRRASQMAGLAARVAKARYQAANSRSFRALARGSTSALTARLTRRERAVSELPTLDRAIEFTEIASDLASEVATTTWRDVAVASD